MEQAFKDVDDLPYGECPTSRSYLDGVEPGDFSGAVEEPAWNGNQGERWQPQNVVINLKWDAFY